MAKMTPIEKNTEMLRPYGVFVCIAPFNFPLALSTGMSSAALLAGNAVVYKPAEDTPWTGLKLYEVYRDAGVPAGAFNFVSGHGRDIGDPLWQHPADRWRRVHRLQRSRDADPPRHQPEVGQALPDGAGRQECGDRDGFRRSRRRGRRRDEVRVRSAEPEVQRHQPGLRASRGGPAVRRQAAREVPRRWSWATYRRRTSTSAR